MINLRLKEERLRLKKKQPEFAECAGTKKRTLIDWEQGVSAPSVPQLAALAEIDVDVVYVLTGIRVAESARKNISLMLSTTAQVDPDGSTDLSQLALQAALDIAAAAEKQAAEVEALRVKFNALDDAGRAAVESMMDLLLTKK